MSDLPTRREFVAKSTSALAALAAVPVLPRTLRRELSRREPEFVARPFDLHQVRLLPGPFRDDLEVNRRYLMGLDPDRLLHSFRITAGLPSTAEPYYGWEAPNNELRGHFVGHYPVGMCPDGGTDWRRRRQGTRRPDRRGARQVPAAEWLPQRLSRANCSIA